MIGMRANERRERASRKSVRKNGGDSIVLFRLYKKRPALHAPAWTCEYLLRKKKKKTLMNRDGLRSIDEMRGREWNGKKIPSTDEKTSEWETPKNRYVFEQWPGMLLIWWNGKKVSRTQAKTNGVEWEKTTMTTTTMQNALPSRRASLSVFPLHSSELWIVLSRRWFGPSPFAVACTHHFHITRLKLFNWTFIIYQTRLCVAVVVVAVVCIICE